MNPDQEMTPEEEQMARDMLALQSQQGSWPEPTEKKTLLAFAEKVIDQEDDIKQIKTANFRDEEVGRAKVPVVSYLHLANYADVEGHDVVANYLRRDASLIAAASLGRRAKIWDSLFTVRRETKNLGTPRETKKKSMFGGETVVKEGMEG